MASEWQSLPLSELYDFASGLSKPRSAFGAGYPFLSFKDVFYRFFVPKELSELVSSTEQERAKCSIKRGDVFLTRTSETVDELGMSCVALCDIPNGTFNGFTKRLRPKTSKRVVPEYAGYYFRSPAFRRTVNAMSTMSTRASLNNEMLARLSIDIPPLAEQKTIGHILGTLDDKIELNRRMNETLEAMARALFKSWFVDFDPVHAKAEGRDPSLPKPLADLFPARLVDSELGEIPEGWEVRSVDEFALLNPETWSRDTRPDVIRYVDLSNTKWGRIDTVTTYTQQDAPSRAQRVLRSSDTIVGTVRPGNGSYAFIAEDGLTGSMGFAVLRPRKGEYAEFVYLAVTARENIESLSHLADGGAYPAVRHEVVAATRVARANDELLKRFSRSVGPLITKCSANGRESRTLATVRNTLLPKLIAGELGIKETERIVERAR